MDEDLTGRPPDDADGGREEGREAPAPEAPEEATGETATGEAATEELGAGPDEPTSVLDGDEPTSLLPGEAPTSVMPPAELTRVMPVPPSLSPPPSSAPPPLSPTVSMTKSRTSRMWLWIILVLVVLAALAVTMFLLFRPGETSSAGQDFIGTWMPADAGPGGLVIKQNGDTFTVTSYDAQIQPVGSGEATLESGELKLSLPAAALGASGGSLDVTISYISGQDSLHLVAQGATRIDEDYVRTDVLQPARTTPAPTSTPTPTLTPTPSVTPTTTGSPSATADQVIIAGVTKIQGGVTAWATNSNGVYPAASEVSSTGGIAQYVNPWPLNPYTNQPMKVGTSPGDYMYEQLNGGSAYKLTAYLGNNLTYNLP